MAWQHIWGLQDFQKSFYFRISNNTSKRMIVLA
jgi:hypothetical protein